MDSRVTVKVWRLRMVNTQSLRVRQQAARVTTGPMHAGRQAGGWGRGRGCRGTPRWTAGRRQVVEVVGEVELRRGRAHSRVGGCRHGDEHAVHRVVGHVVHLRVNLIPVVAGPGNEMEKCFFETFVINYFTLKIKVNGKWLQLNFVSLLKLGRLQNK